jgi:retron-type reverse transcriptase
MRLAETNYVNTCNFPGPAILKHMFCLSQLLQTIYDITYNRLFLNRFLPHPYQFIISNNTAIESSTYIYVTDKVSFKPVI